MIVALKYPILPIIESPNINKMVGITTKYIKS